MFEMQLDASSPTSCIFFREGSRRLPMSELMKILAMMTCWR